MNKGLSKYSAVNKYEKMLVIYHIYITLLTSITAKTAVNIALKKPTSMSSTSQHAHSKYAVDGYMGSDLETGYCASTHTNDNEPWLMIDLQKPSLVQSVLISTKGACGGQADIVFLLDESGSVGASNFVKMKQFVANFLQSFNIGPTGIQIGVDIFASVPRRAFSLNTYTCGAAIMSAVDRILYRSGGTSIGTAIRFIKDHSFTSAAGLRPNVTHVAILMTDGRSGDQALAVSEATKLKARGVKVITLGIGRGVNAQDLRDIASDPDSQYALRVSSFDDVTDLPLLISLMTKSVCKENGLNSFVIEMFEQHPQICTSAKPKGCSNYTGIMRQGEIKTFTCDTPIRSRFVRIRKWKVTVNEVLTLCEVEVFSTEETGQSSSSIFRYFEGRRLQSKHTEMLSDPTPLQCGLHCKQKSICSTLTTTARSVSSSSVGRLTTL